MDDPIDPITEADIEAYVEDQLPTERRIAVEAYLGRNPPVTMRVIADLRIRDELLLALADPPRTQRVGTMDAARRLQRGFARDRFLRQIRLVTAAVVLIVTGWLAHAEFSLLGAGAVIASTTPPAYVGDAVVAYQTTLLRAAMHSQPANRDYDPAEIRSATGIVMPALPADWTVTDVEIFPSSFGPSVEMAIRSKVLGGVWLFAVRPGRFNVIPATLAQKDDVAVAYWQIGDVAFALLARGDAKELQTTATRLADTLY